MKSLAMFNLNRISPNADFCSEINQLVIMLETLNKNILYCTHQDDKILKILHKLIIDDKLQSTVDKFFEDETSPQTDQVEQ